MSGDLRAPRDAWVDALAAAELLAVHPGGVGGIHVRAGPGPQRDAVVRWVRELMPAGAPFARVPIHVTEDRLLGGISLAATLGAGKLVHERGLLAEADGGVVVLAMAERLDVHVTSHVCAALDRAELSIARDGRTETTSCRVGVLALDEGLGEEQAPIALTDRLAFSIDLTPLPPRSEPPRAPDAARCARARSLLPRVTVGPDVVAALCEAASALGVGPLRAPLLAAAAPRAHAALEGRAEVGPEDAAAAARLVLGHRATRVPLPDDSPPEPPPKEEPSLDAPREDDRGGASSGDGEEREAPPSDLQEIVLEAARSAIPSGLLDALAEGRVPRRGAARTGRAGSLRAGAHGGRPAGTRHASGHPGERLAVVDTLRAAAPWQRLRRREAGPRARLVEVRKEDFRVARFRERAETSVIFTVDASGSAALQRLAEAKGAVERVLADCYARRDHVALIAFRAKTASLLLPPTRSLTRVRRCLADLAGGGATPLAAGIDAALQLALDAEKRGRTPIVVVMTDGRANVARSGAEGREAAMVDALASARAVRAARVRALFLDTAPRPRTDARRLADEMGARYIHLPYVDSAGISQEVQAMARTAP